jgi:hypothetical protein
VWDGNDEMPVRRVRAGRRLLRYLDAQFAAERQVGAGSGQPEAEVEMRPCWRFAHYLAPVVSRGGGTEGGWSAHGSDSLCDHWQVARACHLASAGTSRERGIRPGRRRAECSGSRPALQGEIRALLELAITEGTLPAQPLDALAHVLLAAIDEAALFIASADDPPAARDQAVTAVDRLLAGLKTTSQTGSA